MIFQIKKNHPIGSQHFGHFLPDPCRSVFVLYFAIVLSLFLQVFPLLAEERELKTDSKDHLDAVLLLDSSGSMLVTDPARLRDEGAKLFVEFLKPGDRLALIDFSSSAHVVRPLSEFKRENIEEVKQQIGKIENNGLYTDLLAGLKEAKAILDANPNENANQVIILLSDGKMEPDPAVAQASSQTADLTNTLLPDLKTKGVKVYTLSFSEQADRELLARIAAATDGVHWFSLDTSKIHESYAELFVAAKKPQMVALSSKGFKIDPEITEATFYVNREGTEDVKLSSPSGKEVNANTKDENIRWFHGQKFDVVTLNQPEVGQWQILGLPRNDGFATVLTNLKLVTDWPPSANAGTPSLLQARLYESERPVALPEMSGVTRFAFRVTPTDKVSEPIIKEFLVDDGTSGDKIANDGIFSALVKIEEPGEYRLRVVAQSPTFERSQQISFRVKPALISLSVASVEQEGLSALTGHDEGESAAHDEGEATVGEDAHEKESETGAATDEAANNKSPKNSKTKKRSSARDYFRVELSDEAAQLKRIQVKLQAVDEKRTITLLPLSQSRDNSLRYEVPARYLPHDGKYELLATLTGEGRGKKDVRTSSQPLSYDKSSKKLYEAPQVVEIELEHKVVEEPGFPWWALVVVTFLNAAVGGVCWMLYKKALSTDATPIPDFIMPVTIVEGLAELEKMVALNEIDLDDPILEAAENNGSTSSSAAAAEGSSSAPEGDTAVAVNAEEAGTASEGNPEPVSEQGGEAAATEQAEEPGSGT